MLGYASKGFVAVVAVFFGIAPKARAQTEVPDPHATAFVLVGPQTLDYTDGPTSVIAWNLGIAVRPRDAVAGAVVYAGGASGTSKREGTRTRYEAFAFRPGLRVTGTTTGSAAPFFGIGALLASASIVSNPDAGETTRVSAGGVGGWADVGIHVSPDDTFEVGIAATYSWLELKVEDTKVNGGGVGISGSIGIRFGGRAKPHRLSTSDDPSSGEETPISLWDPEAAEKRDFWASRPPTQSTVTPDAFLESQTGKCEIRTLDEGVREARLQELIALDLADGSNAKGTLDAVQYGIIQLRISADERRHVREADVKSFSQF